MSDQGPTDPTRPIPQTGGQPPADDPTSVIRTETTEASGRTLPPEPPRSGGVSTGLAIGAALAVGLLGLLIGFVIFAGDDDDDAEVDETAEVDDTAAEAEAAALAEVEAERDELAGQVEELTGQTEDLQTQLDDVTAERDELQAQLDEADEGDAVDAVETTPAPDVTGVSVEDARATASDNNWEIFERDAENPPADAEPGTVVEQSPSPDTPMVEGSVLVVQIVPEPDA